MQIDSYNTPDAEALLRAAPERLARAHSEQRELIVSIGAAASFLLAAILLPVLSPHTRTLSLPTVVLVLAVWLAVERIKFPVAGGWSRGTMLVFVPALFLLPTPFVPLVAMLGILGRQAAGLVRGTIDARLLPGFIADAWFTVGPVIVLVAAGAQNFSWSHWPVYAAALLAQFAFDGAAAVWWSWAVENVSPRVQLPLLGWVYLVDAAIAPLGLAIAASAAGHQELILIALSPMVMLAAFARERRERLEGTLALSTAYRGTALLLGDVVEADDHYTGTHSRDVVDLSLAVADALKLKGILRRNVEFAALLHDVGKIHVPKEIINKPGRLTDDEWQILRQHTIDGEKMLKQVGGMLSSVGRLVRSTHERFDGLGYPDGLAGQKIPIESRIVSACDAYSAMTTDRAYRPAMSVGEAVEELRRCAGTQFDPIVVEALVGHVLALAPSAVGLFAA